MGGRNSSGTSSGTKPNQAALVAAGWRVMVIWECAVRREAPGTLETAWPHFSGRPARMCEAGHPNG